MDLILKPFALLLGLFYNLTDSYGFAIILFCLVFKIILFPISIKGRKSMLDMSRLGDKQKELQQKYGRDRTRYSEELNKLYTTENVKPSGGCLWTILPLPLLFALFGVVNAPFTHLMGLNGDQVKALTDFILGDGASGGRLQLGMAQSVYDNFAGVQAALPDIANQIQQAGGPINFTFFGLNLSTTPDPLFFNQPGAMHWATIGLFLIPLVSAILSLASMRVNQHINQKILGIGANKQSDAMNKQMMFLQPVISLWIGFSMPAALGMYWIANALFGIVQEYCSIGILKKHLADSREKAEQRALLEKEKEKEQKRQLSEQKKKKAEEARRIKMERSVATEGISDGRIGMRAYARGRTFDADRYPVTPYHDPDDIIKEQRAAREAAAALRKEEKPAVEINKPRKGKNKHEQDDLPKGMVLNQSVQRDFVEEEPPVQDLPTEVDNEILEEDRIDTQSEENEEKTQD